MCFCKISHNIVNKNKKICIHKGQPWLYQFVNAGDGRFTESAMHVYYLAHSRRFSNEMASFTHDAGAILVERLKR